MTIDDFLRMLERDLGRVPHSLGADTELGGVSTWDSMSVLMVISMADAEFGKTVTGAEVRAARTPAALLTLIEKAPART